jgi:hypothetical protein
VPADFYAMIHFDGTTVLAHAINAAGSSDAEAMKWTRAAGPHDLGS